MQMQTQKTYWRPRRSAEAASKSQGKRTDLLLTLSSRPKSPMIFSGQLSGTRNFASPPLTSGSLLVFQKGLNAPAQSLGVIMVVT